MCGTAELAGVVLVGNSAELEGRVLVGSSVRRSWLNELGACNELPLGAWKVPVGGGWAAVAWWAADALGAWLNELGACTELP